MWWKILCASMTCKSALAGESIFLIEGLLVVKVESFSYRNGAGTVAKVFKKACWGISSKNQQNRLLSRDCYHKHKRHSFKPAHKQIKPSKSIQMSNQIKEP